MKLPKSWSGRNIPEELWPEILSQLPVKTLLRFRCVSRSWGALIDDPDFARLHLHRFSKNRCETHLLALHGPLRQNNLQVRCTQSLKVTARLSFPRTIDDDQPWRDSCCALSSIDGLFMLKRDKYESLPTPELMLWNPATRKTLFLPPSPVISTDAEWVEVVDLGLGFDPFFKDYKHVRVFLVRESGDIHSIAVYSLATNSWKLIRRDQGNNRQYSRWRRLSLLNGSALCLIGVLFRLARTQNSGAVKLVSFDLRSETLDSTMLPVVEDPWAEPSIAMADDGCSLAFLSLSYPKGSGSGSIWVLEGLGADGIKSWTWSKCYTFAFTIPELENRAGPGNFFYLMQNGELLLQWHSMMTFYNLKTHKEKVIVRKDLQSKAWAWPYMESLVLLS